MTKALGRVSVRGEAAVLKRVCATVLCRPRMSGADAPVEMVSVVEMRRDLPYRAAEAEWQRAKVKGKMVAVTLTGSGARSSVSTLRVTGIFDGGRPVS